MSDSTPMNNSQGNPSEPTPENTTGQEPDYLQPDASSTKSRGAGTAIALGAAAAVLVGASGVYAWTQFNGGGEQPYERMAEGAMFYVQTNTNPTAEQKLAINELAKKFPEAKDEAGYDVLTADNFNGALLAEMLGAKEYDYIGDRMAVAAYPDSNDDGEPEFAFIAQVTDEKAAEGARDDMVKTASDEGEKINVEIRDGYLLATTGDLAKIFPEDGNTLADNDVFADAMDDVEGNAMSGWLDLAQTTETIAGMADETETDVEGSMAFGLKARNDGLDLEMYGEDVKTNGEAIVVSGDQEATAELLNSIVYEESMFNLGITGLGDYAKQAADASGTDVNEEGADFSNDDLPGLLGSNAALSLRFDEDVFAGKLVLTGVDEKLITKAFGDEGMSIDEAETMLQDRFGEDVKIELSDGELVAIMGDDSEGVGDFESGTVVGSLDMDQMSAMIESFNSSGEDPLWDLGTVSFSAELEDDGDSKTVVGWTTKR